jgi:hypothetical protein
MIIVNMLFMLGVNIAMHVKSENLSCMFQQDGDDIPAFSPAQLAPMLIAQQGLAGVSQVLIDISLYEFLCAQSPHSMKGMLIGLAYAVQALFVCIGVALQTPFARYWELTYPSCGFIYYSVSVLLCLACFIILTRVVKRYRYRERDEPSKEHQYAEEYYSNPQLEPFYDYSVNNSQII